ncbi:hypothetical protein BDA99DRAFT_530414 [Phascolomyces articulosus]|uniref:Uncharacterized protein n=1 Tax=Phascolomyces articulosus TaxID=60185 RepID=A0AAD5JK78_9FUNG|nr:hypothetical protein BDA99DRAFT_530414 [Phascolomyces articulosus]
MVQTHPTDILTFFSNVSADLQEKPQHTSQVIFESFIFAAHCDLGNVIIKPILERDVSFQKELWDYCTKDFSYDNMAVCVDYKDTLKAIVKLVNSVQQQHGLFKSKGHAYDNEKRNHYIHVLKDETTRFRELLNCLYLFNPEGTPKLTIQHFQPIMSADAYDFWKLLSADVVVSWAKFSSIYNILFGSVEPQYQGYVKQFLCEKKSENVTAFTFIALIERFGFPFAKNNDKNAMTEEGRVEVTKMMMDLMRELASSEMRGHLLTVYDWYRGVERTPEALEKRANQWADIIKSSPRTDVDATKVKKTEDQQRADNLDLARRAISLFYQRYMVLWKIGPAAREVIKNVDSPGKARMRDFLTYVLPLDKANLIVVIGADAKNWDSKRPKVYDFIHTLVNPATK